MKNKIDAIVSFKMEMAKNAFFVLAIFAFLSLVCCVEKIGENNQQAFTCFMLAIIFISGVVYLKMTGLDKKIAQYDALQNKQEA